MPKISLEHGFIRISLTAVEARNYGFHAAQPHSLIRQIEDDGGCTLVYSSEPSQRAPIGKAVAVWIPPLRIFPGSEGSSAPSTTVLDAAHGS